MSVVSYDWWGSGGKEPPPELKTKNQLAEMGLRPVEPVGVIETRKYNCLLYDSTNPASAAPKRQRTEKQLEVLARNRAKAAKKRAYQNWLEEYGFIEIDRVAAVKWAIKTLIRKNAVVLDTETTGRRWDDEIIEIALCNLKGKQLLNTLVRTERASEPDAFEVHKISPEMLKDAPTFPEIYPALAKALEGKFILGWSVEFDIAKIDYACKLHNLPSLDLEQKYEDVMAWYSQWFGDWRAHYRSYHWQPLCGGHRALGDCLTVVKRLQEMAKDSAIVQYPKGIEPP